MLQVVTITSKRQLTLPAKFFKKLNLQSGQKVTIREEGGELILTPAENLVERLAGILVIPEKWKGKSIDNIVEQSKEDYFANYKR